VELGPGLLGRIFDGTQRPLPQLAARAGDFVTRGLREPAIDRALRWTFEPAVRAGDRIVGGCLLGRARAGDRSERVIAPPDADGVVRSVPAPSAAAAIGILDPVIELEGGSTLAMSHRWPVRQPRPYARRLPSEVPLLTGQRVLDCFFPVARGSVAIVPGGFGTGKTILEQSLAKHGAADVIVFVGCGERGNEMAELLDEFPGLRDPHTGRPLLERTVLVVNTSNMPVAAREASIYTGVTIAEYFRDLGLHAALMIDSTSRWAEALREISSRLGEMPGEEGYPTYLATRVSQFYERAGRVVALSGAEEGSVTIVGAVSPPAGDFSEPVTQSSLRATSAMWALSPELAHRRHYPAIDWAQSFTLDADRLGAWFCDAAGEEWASLREEAMRLLQEESELQEIAQLVGIEALQDAERLVLESARLIREGFLRQSAYHEIDATCPPKKTLAMLRLFLEVHRRAAEAVSRGAPLSKLLAARLDDRLLRFGELPEAELAQAEAAARADLDRALRGLEEG
jgi:V/A-type H+-transporting ATPase subunit A